MEIVQLKNRLSELLEEKKIVMNQTQEKALKLDRKCTLCQAKLTKSHLCVDEENIACPLCSQTFLTTVQFVNHINIEHADVTNVIDNNSLFKCNQCAVGYPMEILLECHRKAHENALLLAKELNQSKMSDDDIKSESEQLDILFETNDGFAIDDTASNDSSVLSVFLVSVETDDEESSGDKSPLATDNASSEELSFERFQLFSSQLNEMSDKISQSSASESAAIKRKLKSQTPLCYRLTLFLFLNFQFLNVQNVTMYSTLRNN